MEYRLLRANNKNQDSRFKNQNTYETKSEKKRNRMKVKYILKFVNIDI